MTRRKIHLKRFQVPVDKRVLVGVLKRKKDLEILLRERWYRVPVRYAPKKPFGYLAVYQPAFFGREGKCIRHYARVLNQETLPRKKILPNEISDPRAEALYIKITVSPPRALTHPIRNTAPRRVSFGFTTIGRLLTSKNLLELYNIPPTEEIVRKAFLETGIRAVNQHYVSLGEKSSRKPFNKVQGKRYRLDFAIFCKNGKIAVECDNRKAHKGRRQKKYDEAKDVALRGAGWHVVRLSEHDITFELKKHITIIKQTVESLGGLI